jgi:tRNA (cytidine32/uridine32-2'-O)-methyltransferase
MQNAKKTQRGFSVHPDWVSALDNIRFVTVATTHPGNVGAIARVMKNTGLCHLHLVSSVDCGENTEAFPRASGAYEIVRDAQRTDCLEEALAGSVMSLGTSGRVGSKRIAKTPEQVIPEFMRKALTGPVACVFGRESKGLSNEELKLCTHHLIIPTCFEFASMNISHAAAIVGYEIFKAASKAIGFQAGKTRPAATETREAMFSHIEEVLLKAGFLQESNPLTMMRDIRRIFNSAELDDRDCNIIRGIFRKVDNLVRTASTKQPVIGSD